MINLRTAVATVTFGLCASAASAAMVTIENVSGTWTDASSGPVYGLNTGVTAGGVAEINWGSPATGPLNPTGTQSGYTFEGLIPPPVTVDTEHGAQFELGIFTHNNYTLWANVPSGMNAIDSADLSVDFTMSIDGHEFNLNQVYNFSHIETPNEPAGACQFGGTAASGMNGAYGCNDRVTAELNEALSESIVLDGMEYTLDISGFLTEEGFFSFFDTQERLANSAILIAELIVTELPSEVPLPAAGWLLIGGMGGLFALKRKRRQS